MIKKAKGIKKGKEGFSSYDTYFHFYDDQEVETCSYEELHNKLGLKEVSESKESSKHVSDFTKNEYLKILEKAKLYISSGDIYQVNLSQKFNTSPINNAYSTLIKFGFVNWEYS